MVCVLWFTGCISCRWLLSSWFVCYYLDGLFLGAWRDDDPEEWVFIARALFRYKCTFLLEFLHVEVF